MQTTECGERGSVPERVERALRSQWRIRDPGWDPDCIPKPSNARDVNRLYSWRTTRSRCLSHPPSPRGKRASEASGRASRVPQSRGGVDVSWLPLPVQALDFAPNPFGAKPRRGQGVRVSMPSFFRLPISKENLWKAEDQCTELTSGTTPSVFLNTTTLTTNRNQALTPQN